MKAPSKSHQHPSKSRKRGGAAGLSGRQWYRLLFAVGSASYFAGCLYQTCSFLSLYYEYPTAMEVNVEQTPVILFPAVTLCNGNRVRQDLWCSMDPNVCQPKPSESQEEYITRLEETYKWLNRSIRIDMGHTMDKFIRSCYFDEKPCTGSMGQFYNYEYTNCFTINARWANDTFEPFSASMFRPRSGRSSELAVMLDLESARYSLINPVVRARMTIHDTNTVPYPQYDGVSLQPGQTYNYGVRASIAHVLPEPYQTKCKNYTFIKEIRTKSKQTQEGCMSECCAKLHVEYCNCTVHRLSLIYDIPTCWKGKEVECLKNHDQITKDKCYPQCGMACSKKLYNYISVDSFTLQQGACFAEDLFNKTLSPNDKANLICLKVFFASADSEIYRHVPKYSGIQVFSIIGGYIGLWLGVSLLNVHNYLLSSIFTCLAKKKVGERG